MEARFGRADIQRAPRLSARYSVLSNVFHGSEADGVMTSRHDQLGSSAAIEVTEQLQTLIDDLRRQADSHVHSDPSIDRWYASTRIALRVVIGRLEQILKGSR